MPCMRSEHQGSIPLERTSAGRCCSATSVLVDHIKSFIKDVDHAMCTRLLLLEVASSFLVLTSGSQAAGVLQAALSDRSSQTFGPNKYL